MKFIYEGLLIGYSCICTIALFQIVSGIVLAIEQPVPNMNKSNFDYQLESNITNDKTINEIAYKNPQHGIFMLFPSNWTFSTSGLPEYNQIAAFYAPLQNLSDPIPARLIIAVMSYDEDVRLEEFTNMTISSLNQTGQLIVSNSDPITLAGRPGHQIIFSTLPNMGNPFTLGILYSWTVVDNKVYAFQYSMENTNFDNYLPIVKHILESLRIE